MTENDLQLAAEAARDLVQEAGELVRGLQGRVAVRDKGGDEGLVTDADLAAETLLLEGLAARFPGDPIISEETRANEVSGGGRIWCVDPIDGTREYAQGLDEYACMAGLLVDGEPAAGAFSLPAEGLVFWGWRGGGAYLNRDPLDLEEFRDLGQATAIHSRSHKSPRLADVLARLGVARTKVAGGAGYKVAQVLLGHAQVYVHPRRGTMWWDSVAPAAVLLAAGGFVGNAKGQPLLYEQGLHHASGLLFVGRGLGETVVARLLRGG